MDWFHMAKDRCWWGDSCEHNIEPSGFVREKIS
jgi:hypothetical protein